MKQMYSCGENTTMQKFLRINFTFPLKTLFKSQERFLLVENVVKLKFQTESTEGFMKKFSLLVCVGLKIIMGFHFRQNMMTQHIPKVFPTKNLFCFVLKNSSLVQNQHQSLSN